VGESLIVVSFDPGDPTSANRVEAFRVHYGMTSEVTMIGPFDGKLSNQAGELRLTRPDDPPASNPTTRPATIVDVARYEDTLPWEMDADGTGQSLHRLGATFAGIAPESWTAETPSPGRVPVAAEVISFEINGGRQTRSEITSIEVQVPASVAISPDSFQLIDSLSGALLEPLQISEVENGGTTNITVSFSKGDFLSDAGTAGLARTLADGNYQLRYRLPGFGPDSDRVDTFFRKYGDSDGDGSVNLLDFADFRRTFGRGVADDAFDSGLDANRDGSVNLFDFASFRQAFGT
ncbi:MAG: dockerin type I domain-containing protein, partial [Planctomycetota bacterium]